MLLSSGQVPGIPDSSIYLGELSLDGGLRHTNGILPMVAVAREEGIETVFVPSADSREAALVHGIDVVPISTLAELVAHIRGDELIAAVAGDDGRSLSGQQGAAATGMKVAGGVDMSDIRGQEHAKRALEVAAAGGHNLLISDPPGSGKTLLARSIPSILPALTPQEALDVTKIYSVSSLLPPDMREQTCLRGPA